MSEVAGIMHRLVADASDHVAGAQPGLIGAAALFHRPHQHSIPVLRAKKLAQLRREILHHQTAAHRRMHHYDANVRNIEIRHVRHRRNLDVEVLVLVLVLRPHVGKFVAAVGQLHLDGHRLSIAAQP